MNRIRMAVFFPQTVNFFVWLLLSSMLLQGAAFADLSPESGRALYQTHCAGCQGALASPLIKTDWDYGRRPFALANNIRHGIAAVGMPAWGGRLTDAEIDQLVTFILDAQGHPPEGRALPQSFQTEQYLLRVERLVTGLQQPWGLEFIDQRRALITENAGHLWWVVDGQLDPQPITGIPPVDTATSTGGLLDIAVDPGYAGNGWIYLAISHSENPADVAGPGMTQIIRGRIKDYRWVDNENLFRLDDSFNLPNSKHWGGRLLFDKAGYLYFSIGDMSQPLFSQNLGKPSGKVFRINPDGSIPADNPFVKTQSALGQVFSFGNRNVQGLAQHPQTGVIWASEHGPWGGDELNILHKGNNYGWPLVSYGVNYDGTLISEHPLRDGIVAPVAQWTPAPAVCPIEFVGSSLFPAWENNLLLGTLAFEELRRLVIDGDQVIHQEILFKGYGRIRDIKTGPDGALYILLNNPGALVRLTPGKNN